MNDLYTLLSRKFDNFVDLRIPSVLFSRMNDLYTLLSRKFDNFVDLRIPSVVVYSDWIWHFTVEKKVIF